MKTKFIFLPITLTALTPTIGLVGCDNFNPEGETKFTTTTGTMSSATEATFAFDWANGHSLAFESDWEFTTNAGTVQSVTATGGDTKPQTVSLTFKSDISEDITDGKLIFTYNDLTAKKDNITATIQNICITKYTPTPEIHTVTFLAGNHGLLEGETTITVEGNETTLGDITKPTVVADEEQGWFFEHWDYDDSYVIDDDVTVTAQYRGEIDVNINYSMPHDEPRCISEPYFSEKDTNYLFRIDASACQSEYFGTSSFCTFCCQPIGTIDVEIIEVCVGDKKFDKVDNFSDILTTPGKYYYGNALGFGDYLYVNDYNEIQKTFKMTVQLKFKNEPVQGGAEWTCTVL